MCLDTGGTGSGFLQVDPGESRMPEGGCGLHAGGAGQAWQGALGHQPSHIVVLFFRIGSVLREMHFNKYPDMQIYNEIHVCVR